MDYREACRRRREALAADDLEMYRAWDHHIETRYSWFDRLSPVGRIVVVVLACLYFGVGILGPMVLGG